MRPISIRSLLQSFGKTSALVQTAELCDEAGAPMRSTKRTKTVTHNQLLSNGYGGTCTTPVSRQVTVKGPPKASPLKQNGLVDPIELKVKSDVMFPTEFLGPIDQLATLAKGPTKKTATFEPDLDWKSFAVKSQRVLSMRALRKAGLGDAAALALQLQARQQLPTDKLFESTIKSLQSSIIFRNRFPGAADKMARLMRSTGSEHFDHPAATVLREGPTPSENLGLKVRVDNTVISKSNVETQVHLEIQTKPGAVISSVASGKLVPTGQHRAEAKKHLHVVEIARADDFGALSLPVYADHLITVHDPVTMQPLESLKVAMTASSGKEKGDKAKSLRRG